MAWEAWKPSSGYTSKRVWSRMSDFSGGTVLCYSIDVTYKYRRDVIANKSQIFIHSVKLGQHISGWGMGGCIMHAAVGIYGSNSAEKTKMISGGPPNSIEIVFDHVVDVPHDPQGNFIHTIAWYCWVNSTDSHRPTFGNWQYFKPNVTKIGRDGPTISVSETGKNINSISYNIKSTYYTTLIQYSFDGKTWHDTGVDIPTSDGGSVGFKLTGLSPNTYYSVRFRCRRDYNEVWSNTATVNTTTPKPSAPSKGSVSVSNITDTSAKFTISGFGFGTGATWGEYQQGFDFESWQGLGKSTSFSRTGLKPNTTYKMQVRLVDNYGSVSGAVEVQFKTLKPNRPTKGTVSISNITPFTAKVSWSGFKASSNASVSKYYWSLDTKNWNSVGTNTSVVIDGLNEETNYTVYIVAEDNFGSQSERATATFKTLVDQLKVKVNVGGKTKVGKVFVNVGGQMKKVKQAFVHVNGTAKKVLKG